MADQAGEFAELRALLRDFAKERDWDQFHTPKNLAASVCIEAAELLEAFQWLPTGSPAELTEAKLLSIRQELADTLLYVVRLADKVNVDLMSAAREKIALNRKKYPADRVRGDARKYSEYDL